MSVWVIIVAATALGGALILWHAVSRTKHVSEQLLAIYGQMLIQAREARARKNAELAEEAETAKPGKGPAPAPPLRPGQSK